MSDAFPYRCQDYNRDRQPYHGTLGCKTLRDARETCRWYATPNVIAHVILHCDVPIEVWHRYRHEDHVSDLRVHRFLDGSMVEYATKIRMRFRDGSVWELDVARLDELALDIGDKEHSPYSLARSLRKYATDVRQFFVRVREPEPLDLVRELREDRVTTEECTTRGVLLTRFR